MLHDQTHPTHPPHDQTSPVSDQPEDSPRQRLALLLGQLLAWAWLRKQPSAEKVESDSGTETQE